MAIYINPNDLLNRTKTLGSAKVAREEKTESSALLNEKESEIKEKNDIVDFKAETANANKEAANSRIKNKEEAFEMVRALKEQVADSPEKTAVVHANIAPDAALQLLS